MKANSTIRPILQVQRVGIIALALILAGFWVYVHWIEPGPFYAHYYDPELPYMMSSLSVFKGHTYVYIDHPGTPIEVLGSALFALTYPITKGASDSFVMYHVRHPELFLSIAHALLTLGSIVCVVLLARYAITVEHWTDALFSIAVSAFFYAVHPLAFESLVLWSHNSFNLPVGSLLLLVLLVTLRSGRQLRWWQVSALGFGAGVLTSVQIYFATWVIGTTVSVAILYLLQKHGWLKTILACLNAGLASLFGFLAATLPIITQYPRFTQWVEKLLFHQGRYGKGALGLTSPEQFLIHFMQMWRQLRVLFIAACLVVATLGIAMFLQRRNLKRNLGLWAVTCGLFVQLIVTVAIIIKHPGVVYMLAVAAILPLLLAIAFTLLRSSGPRIRLLFAGISIAILIGFLHNLTNSVNNHHALLSRLQSAEKEIESYFAEYAAATGQDRDSLMILWTYGTDSRCYALWFGNDYAKRVFSKEISQVCPHQVQLNIWNRKVLLPDGWLPIDSDLDWDIIVAAQNILRNYPYLADYSETVISQAKTAYFGNVVFILPLFPGSQAGPDNYPLITVEPSLAGAVGIDPQLKAPWPIEVYEDHSLSFLWLGYGEAEGVAGTLWSDAARQVVLEFEVSPGPSRADQQRTVQLAMQSNGQVTAQRETFDEPLALTFPVQLQPGRNDFQFTVLDEATIPVDGDTRPLLVFLRHITVKSLSGLR